MDESQESKKMDKLLKMAKEQQKELEKFMKDSKVASAQPEIVLEMMANGQLLILDIIFTLFGQDE